MNSFLALFGRFLPSPALCQRCLLLSTLVFPLSAQAQDTAIIDELMWALETNGEDVPWAEADAYCNELSLDGHSDWRLPQFAELSAQFDPSRQDTEVFIRAPLPDNTCCLWSSTSTAERPPEEGHFYVDRRGEPEDYMWGYLYAADPIEYYSVKFFPDGQALCVRSP